MAITNAANYTLDKKENYWRACFSAMASPCELLIDTEDFLLADRLSQLSVKEVQRIEQKFSRYREGNICSAINRAEGKAVAIDEECARLFSFADTCYQISDGLFDLTSGVLRRAWKFDGSSNLAEQRQIDALLPLVGWEKVSWNNTTLQMPAGMELDFGGIGKEYAVSRVAQLCAELADISVLVNLGGDIQITRERSSEQRWVIGLEDPRNQIDTAGILTLKSGALATSGDANRYLLKNGVRYSHILNPRTGWPITDAPSSVTVASALCIEAGSLATIALLHGRQAEEFLAEQGVRYWCVRV